MAHFAQINTDGTVLRVIVVSDDDAPTEQVGRAFIANALGLPGEWVQTSYSGNFRKQYAGNGYTYDPVANVFVAPRPFPSWTLDGNHDWQPPSPRPAEEGTWVWDEATLSWVAPPEQQAVDLLIVDLLETP